LHDFFLPLTAAPHALGVSLRHDAGEVSAITVYANWTALPRDEECERLWTASLREGDERLAYQLALAGAKSLGFRPSIQWHAMAGWTVRLDGSTGRAMSLCVPQQSCA